MCVCGTRVCVCACEGVCASAEIMSSLPHGLLGPPGTQAPLLIPASQSHLTLTPDGERQAWFFPTRMCTLSHMCVHSGPRTHPHMPASAACPGRQPAQPVSSSSAAPRPGHSSRSCPLSPDSTLAALEPSYSGYGLPSPGSAVCLGWVESFFSQAPLCGHAPCSCCCSLRVPFSTLLLSQLLS